MARKKDAPAVSEKTDINEKNKLVLSNPAEITVNSVPREPKKVKDGKFTIIHN